MKQPSLEIVLDETGGAFQCGAPIKGVVKAAVHEECTDKKLIIALGYRIKANAPGQTIASCRDIATTQLFIGDWKPGIYTYPFSLAAPEGCNYAGAIMTVAWYLRAGIGAGASTSFDFEPANEKGIHLLPAGISPEDIDRKKASEVTRRESAGAMKRCVLPAALLSLGGLFLAWIGWEGDWYLFGLVPALIGIAVLGLAIWLALIDRKIASSELRIGAVVLWPGTSVPCSLTIQAKVPIEIDSATITLEAWEHVKKFTGIYRTTGPVNRHTVYMDKQPLELPARTFPARVPVRLEGKFVVPPGAICTMDFDNEAKLLWQAEFRMKIKGSPDWFDVQPITVLPRIERGTNEEER